MAHELNNPLAGMIQSAQVIQNRLTQEIPANERAAVEAGASMAAIRIFMEKRGIAEHLGNICEAGKRAAQIVGNMLSFARKSGSEREANDAAELVDAVIVLAGSDPSLKRIPIVREYQPGLPPIACEKSKIQQVIFNILKNASDAIGTQATTHPQPRITVRLFERSKVVYIGIEDNGPGMDESTRKRVFEPFFTTKPVDRGTGLGLSVSYFIVVEDHGGTLTVESAPGKGTRFLIGLGAADPVPGGS
jgi:signal transduction histidine kinase